MYCFTLLNVGNRFYEWNYLISLYVTLDRNNGYAKSRDMMSPISSARFVWLTGCQNASQRGKTLTLSEEDNQSLFVCVCVAMAGRRVECVWKRHVAQQLKQRDRVQRQAFEEIIQQCEWL